MKKGLSVLLLFIFSVLSVFSLTACGKKYIKGTIYLNKENLLISVDASETLVAVFSPEKEGADVSSVVLTWKSSKPSVATVDEAGKVAAVSVGKTTITVAYGKASATCEVEVFDPEDRETVVVEDSRINISKRQNKMSINLKKGLGYLYGEDDLLLSITDANGVGVPFTLNGNVATVSWDGAIGMHVWTFHTKYKAIIAEVCHATHIVAKISDFGPLSDDWDTATLGNSGRNYFYQNATKDWYVVLDDDIVAGGGEDLSYKNTYSFGNNYAAETQFDAKGNVTNDHYFAIFNGTFDGRGYSITGLNTEAGFIANLGTTGVIKNLALLDARNGRNYSSGILGVYGLGKVENVFIEGYLKEWGSWAAGMYLRVDATHQLEVKDSLVVIKYYYDRWPNSNKIGIFGSGIQANPAKITNSFGISPHITYADGGTNTKHSNYVYQTIEEWILDGGYVDYDGLWEIGQNNIFFGGKQVYSWGE